MAEQQRKRETAGEFRRRLVAMLYGDSFEPTTDEPRRSTRSSKPRKSTAKKSRRTMSSEDEPHAGDDGGQPGAD